MFILIFTCFIYLLGICSVFLYYYASDFFFQKLLIYYFKETSQRSLLRKNMCKKYKRKLISVTKISLTNYLETLETEIHSNINQLWAYTKYNSCKTDNRF